MACGCSDREVAITYECTVNSEGCPPKKASASSTAPSCCGKPMRETVSRESTR